MKKLRRGDNWEPDAMTDDQFIEYAISNIRNEWWFFPDVFWCVGLLISGIGIFFVKSIFFEIATLLASFYCVGQLFFRQGVYYGFRRGYTDGCELQFRKMSRQARES